ncbi:TetR/AcrR family transcriptional regulator [Cryptosporangium phraense]|uniref:TetR/AcrR family transcriptional regulator n=1 Tax=Cryptosporangium phraense TaxID=2593070 RepID=UPI001478A593|nr:TetR/AcrR family transcriptional regulator [Cryptosporangium phraense]
MTTTVTRDGRQRVIDAALAQFAQYGVEGTSLQMIADAMGVTKAAVYYHFKTKDEIVLAVVSPAIEQLVLTLGEAETRRGRATRARAFLSAFVDLVIGHRVLLTLLYDDVAVLRVVRTERPDFDQIADRISAVLVGPDAGPAEEVASAVALTGIVAAAASPDFAELTDAELGAHLLDAGLRLIAPRRRR